MKEAERMLKQIDLEITTNNQLDKNKRKIIIDTYMKKYDELKSKFFKTKETYTYTKKMEEMIVKSQQESALDVNLSTTSETELQSQQLLKKEEIAGKSNQKLEQVKRSAIEMENLSKNVMVDLESQTQKLNGTHSKLVSLNGSLETSSSILNKIINRENRSKALIGIFSVTLITFFIFILSSRL
jgi:hypothetical protein